MQSVKKSYSIVYDFHTLFGILKAFTVWDMVDIAMNVEVEDICCQIILFLIIYIIFAYLNNLFYAKIVYSDNLFC